MKKHEQPTLSNGEKILTEEEKRDLVIDNAAGKIDPTIKSDPNLPKVDPAHATMDARQKAADQEEKAAKKAAKAAQK